MKSLNQILIILVSVTFLFCQKEVDDAVVTIKIKGTITHVSKYGGNDGAIILSVMGGSQPYSYIWSNHQTTKNIEGLIAGDYIVQVTDSKNQVIRDTFEVNQPIANTIIVEFEITDPSQTGATDGKIATKVMGGTAPFNYLWSNGATTKDIEGLPAGNFVLTVTDSHNQTKTDSVMLIDCLKDIDGNLYGIISIGDQIWMKENLRVKRAPDSSIITVYAYNNDTSLIKTNGLLYTWNVVMNGSEDEGAQGICPCGWHIPTDEEFKILEMHLGMTRAEADMVNVWRGTHVGTKLKAGGESGFDARLAGRRASNGAFSLLGRAEYIWTSTTFGKDYAWRRCLDLYSDEIGRWNTFPKSYGFTVRCIKDK